MRGQIFDNLQQIFLVYDNYFAMAGFRAGSSGADHIVATAKVRLFFTSRVLPWPPCNTYTVWPRSSVDLTQPVYQHGVEGSTAGGRPMAGQDCRDDSG
jgi:hypothetical protein